VRGAPLSNLGSLAETLVTAPDLDPVAVDGALHARVIHVDRFGDCITNVERSHLEGWSAVDVEVAGRVLAGPARTYQDVPPGQPLVLFGSSGHLEIAVNRGSASAELGLDIGSPVIVWPSHRQ